MKGRANLIGSSSFPGNDLLLLVAISQGYCLLARGQAAAINAIDEHHLLFGK
jgi:hypothetical protein